jgi:hypothetical protein
MTPHSAIVIRIITAIVVLAIWNPAASQTNDHKPNTVISGNIVDNKGIITQNQNGNNTILIFNQRDQNGLYQNSRKIGYVSGASYNPKIGRLTARLATFTDYIEPSTPIEFQDKYLDCSILTARGANEAEKVVQFTTADLDCATHPAPAPPSLASRNDTFTGIVATNLANPAGPIRSNALIACPSAYGYCFRDRSGALKPLDCPIGTVVCLGAGTRGITFSGIRAHNTGAAVDGNSVGGISLSDVQTHNDLGWTAGATPPSQPAPTSSASGVSSAAPWVGSPPPVPCEPGAVICLHNSELVSLQCVRADSGQTFVSGDHDRIGPTSDLRTDHAPCQQPPATTVPPK